MQSAVHNALLHAEKWLGKGSLPDFIPELTQVDPDRLSISLMDEQGRIYSAGHTQDRFTIQSISKVLAFAFICETEGMEKVLSLVDVEPCGDRFNSIYRLELMEKRPFNPFLNAGAIALFSRLPGRNLEEKYQNFRTFAIRLLGNPQLEYSHSTCDCEMATGHRNRALASMLLDNGITCGDPEEHLMLYYRGCAFLANTEELSRLGAILAFDGINPTSGERLLSPSVCAALRAMMAGCGLYNSTGKYNIEAGIPAKSGSSGAIMAAARNRCGLGVFSPRLDGNGNSICGIKALSFLSDELNLRVL